MKSMTNDASADNQPWHRRLPRASYNVLGVIAALLLIQLVPYGRDHTNPKVNATPTWSSPAVEKLAADSCADCHSNTTTWPWYSKIAPGSWLIQHDVNEGRTRLNWSEPCGEADDVREVVSEGEMPPIQYKLIHANARLSKKEQAQLADGLAQSLNSLNMHECAGGD
jgi:mono/diheme cytochrome c family protein